MNKKISRFFLSVMATVMLFSLMTAGNLTENVSVNPFTVTAQAAAKKTGLNKTKATLTTGATYTLKLLDKKGKTISASKVKWSTSSKKIATVSKKGVVKGVKKGTATITATYKGKKYTCKVTVKNASLSAKKKTLAEGKSFTLKLKDADGKNVSYKKIKWSTSDKKIATVSKKGVVKAVGNGKATITAKYLGKTYKCTVTAKGYIVLSKSSMDIYYGDTDKRTVKVTFNDNCTIYYKIMQGDNLVRVEWSRKWKDNTTSLYITPRYDDQTGTAKIKIYSENQPKNYKTITVKFKEPTVKLSKTSATVKEGSTLKLTATTTPSGKSVTWSTSDDSIATVSSKGVVTPVRAGTCEITARYKYGKYSYEYAEAKCKVTTVFEGSDFTAPVSGQSGKTVTYQEYSSRPQYKVKVKFTKLIRGEQANTIVHNENMYNDKPTAGYEWCLIYADITHVSNTKGSNTVLEASDILYKDVIYTANGASVPVRDFATLSGSLKGMSVLDVEMYPGATASVVMGILIPSNSGDLLLKVPNLSSNTWIKIDAPASSGGNTGGNQGGSSSGNQGGSSGNEQGGTVAPEVPVKTPDENLNTLKQYIRTYGTTVADGKAKRITGEYKRSGITYNVFLQYVIAEDNIWFSVSAKKGDSLADMIDFTMSDTTSSMKITTMLYDTTGGAIRGSSTGTAYMTPSSYTCPSSLSFTWTNVYNWNQLDTSYDPYNVIAGTNGNMVASALLDVGVALWDLMIYNKTGLSMTDIGFGA